MWDQFNDQLHRHYCPVLYSVFFDSTALASPFFFIHSMGYLLTACYYRRFSLVNIFSMTVFTTIMTGIRNPEVFFSPPLPQDCCATALSVRLVQFWLNTITCRAHNLFCLHANEAQPTFCWEVQHISSCYAISTSSSSWTKQTVTDSTVLCCYDLTGFTRWNTAIQQKPLVHICTSCAEWIVTFIQHTIHQNKKLSDSLPSQTWRWGKRSWCRMQPYGLMHTAVGLKLCCCGWAAAAEWAAK